MNILNEAIKTYREKNYAKALELFEQAAALYGQTVVKANIFLCKKALELRTSKHPDSPKPSECLTNEVQKSTVGFSLDPATRYMLAQKGEIELSVQEKQQCLEEYKRMISRKSIDAEVRTVNPIPAGWPKDLVLAPLPESTNDYRWHIRRRALNPKQLEKALPRLSIIIPTYNRSKILEITLACLVNQETEYLFEVIVADDGSEEAIDLVVRQYEPLLDIKYVRQKDCGFRVSAVRNLGMRAAKYDFIAFLDCDMAPNPRWVESYMEILSHCDDTALIGPRKYVDTTSYDSSEFRNNKNLIEQLNEIRTNNKVAGKEQGDISVDWRIEHFQDSEDLRLCDSPFRYFAAGNVAFPKKWLKAVGFFDENFTHWGGEDVEFGYRLYRHGCFFRVVWGAMAYHQEPPGKENETDRMEGKKLTDPIKYDRMPYFYRRIKALEFSEIHSVPMVSIYIPAFNCASTIKKCVDSALNQTIVDLEVCICDDGSTDETLSIIQEQYKNNPRVRYVKKRNGGIGSSSNAAVKMARGFYIGQLDSDDYLEPDAVENCLKEFLADHSLVCVYTTYRNVDSDGAFISDGYNWPEYSREKLATAMIAHHFRMFTVRAWNHTEGFDETLVNAVDYDIFLKLSEVGKFKHINKVSYNRVVHGRNTSILKSKEQKNNHFRVVNSFLSRQGANNYRYTKKTDNDNDREFYFEPLKNN